MLTRVRRSYAPQHIKGCGATSLDAKHDLLSKYFVFFRRFVNHHLLPHQRDCSVLSRLRAPTRLPHLSHVLESTVLSLLIVLIISNKNLADARLADRFGQFSTLFSASFKFCILRQCSAFCDLRKPPVT